MTGAKQLFAPVPLRAMALDLSGLQLRVLVCVAAHDRMSLVTGKGQGCRASNERMRQMVGCNFSRLCSTLTQLADLGLLEKDRLGRHTVYRVVYTEDDRLLFGNVWGRSIGCQEASQGEPIGCRDFPESDSFPPENGSQYIPLNGRNRFCETGEYNSSEEARLATRVVREVARGLKNTRPKAGRSKAARSKSFGERLAILERRMDEGAPMDRVAEYRWLGEEAFDGDDMALNNWAVRLSEKLIGAMTPDEWGQVQAAMAA
jgi:hypothetical protein